MLKKFRGCLIGTLVGDCLGFPYEGEKTVLKSQLQKYFDKIEGPPFKSPAYKYTDDSAMTKSVAASLIENNGFNAKDMATKFVTDYFNDPCRGYGENVTNVFVKLNNENLEDIWKPAREQFNGSGSYGNGGSMRISPVSLFYYNDLNQALNVTRKVTELTHTHPLGVNGAILQALVLHYVLKFNPEEAFNAKEFLECIILYISKIEDNTKRVVPEKITFTEQVRAVDRLLSMSDGAALHHVIDTLGNSVSAIYSVPTALFCFLRARQPIPDIETDNPFRRTVQYAISLGGDTDTIASMAGAIAGAYYGIDYIDENIRKICEDVDVVDKLAIKLYEQVTNVKA